jgi:hypothetical protein
LWGPQTNTVNADAGFFSAELGPIDYSVFDGSDRWLSLQVGNDAEMTPRKRLLSVGNSYRAYDADKVDGKDASAFVQTGQANSISTNMLQNNAVTASKISPKIVSSIDGVSNDGGNVDLVAGDNITITPDNTNNKITITASTAGGDNLGNHTASQNIKLNGKWLSGDGGNEGVFVKSDGKVGIGTGNPQYGLLELKTTTSVAGGLTLYRGTGNTARSWINSSDVWLMHRGGVSTNGIAITDGGKVGIGTTDPIYKLEVNGGIQASLNIRAFGGDTAIRGQGASYGVLGKRGSSSTGNYGYLGSSNYGVYGKSFNDVGSGGAGVYGDGPVGVYATSSKTGVLAEGSKWAVWATGDIYATGRYLPSDQKLKTAAQKLSGLLPKLMQLDAKTYRYKTDDVLYKHLNLPDNKQYGFVAQEVERIFPELVKDAVQPAQTDETGNVTQQEIPIKSINYTGFIPLLLQAIQEQQTRIEALEQRVEQLSK